MQRIDVPSAVAALPAPAAPGAPGYFTAGDPVGGTPATVLSQDWANMIQEELMAIILAAGVAPSKTTFTQLRDALPLIGGNANGNYVKFPSGFMIAWGRGSDADGTGTAAVTFPVPFQTAPIGFATNDTTTGPPAAFHGTGFETTIGMEVYSAKSAATAAGVGTSFKWVALGH